MLRRGERRSWMLRTVAATRNATMAIVTTTTAANIHPPALIRDLLVSAGGVPASRPPTRGEPEKSRRRVHGADVGSAVSLPPGGPSTSGPVSGAPTTDGEVRAMEQRGTTLDPLASLEDLRDLVTTGGPCLTSYVAFEPATESLAEEVRLRWQARRDELADAGAAEEALAVVDDAIDGAHREAEGICVVVPSGAKPLVDLLPWPPAEDAAWGPVPALRPLLALRQRRVPHVVALVDRAGADLRVRRGHREVAAMSVEGDDYP